jgi:Spy/CpxP family protein refolding chaperone
MKHSIILKTLAIFIVAFICQSFTIAQPKDRPMPQREFVKELKKELNLTSDQETKIQKIFDTQNEEMKKERDAMREKMEKQRKETDAKISTVLTDDQKKKYEELQKKHSQRPPRMPKPENE